MERGPYGQGIGDNRDTYILLHLFYFFFVTKYGYTSKIRTKIQNIEAKYNDKDEIMKWPLAVSPYDIAIIPLVTKNENSNLEKANSIYKFLKEKKIDAILDDTEENFSSKLKKFNLIGIPYQIIIGKKSEGDLLEFKEIGKDSQHLSLSQITDLIIKQKNKI